MIYRMGINPCFGKGKFGTDPDAGYEAESDYCDCERCGESILIDDAIDYNDMYLCEDCYEDMTEE